MGAKCDSDDGADSKATANPSAAPSRNAFVRNSRRIRDELAPNAIIVGLLLTLILIFSFQGEVILNNPLHIVLIAVPLVIQTFLIFFIAYLACSKLKLRHDIAAPAGMIGASNFFELAVAVAITLFGAFSPVVLVTVVGVLVEVPVMLALVRFANQTARWFPGEA